MNLRDQKDFSHMISVVGLENVIELNAVRRKQNKIVFCFRPRGAA